MGCCCSALSCKGGWGERGWTVGGGMGGGVWMGGWWNRCACECARVRRWWGGGMAGMGGWVWRVGMGMEVVGGGGGVAGMARMGRQRLTWRVGCCHAGRSPALLEGAVEGRAGGALRGHAGMRGQRGRVEGTGWGRQRVGLRRPSCPCAAPVQCAVPGARGPVLSVLCERWPEGVCRCCARARSRARLPELGLQRPPPAPALHPCSVRYKEHKAQC